MILGFKGEAPLAIEILLRLKATDWLSSRSDLVKELDKYQGNNKRLGWKLWLIGKMDGYITLNSRASGKFF